MKFHKYIKNGYIVTIGMGDGGTEITEDEYVALYMLIRERPTPPKGYGYRLREDYTWEAYELPPLIEEETE